MDGVGRAPGPSRDVIGQVEVLGDSSVRGPEDERKSPTEDPSSYPSFPVNEDREGTRWLFYNTEFLFILS